ncbi:FAD-binding protein [Leucobacter allii]|uniref:FAD-binding protein n=1 Tax=Leucobacter allii TaxID=2932247 RepID=A0ABY4FPL2_9MICO|nr:D-arabinono-1,4-lactone oxidase [Leucobacter allii]UOQ58139.1 FAD-binding protein [Leucobacter allii]
MSHPTRRPPRPAPRPWSNWAGTERSLPALAIAPRSEAQIVRAVQRARETGRTLKPIGASHSFTAIGATDGIRLDPDGLSGLVSADVPRGRVTLLGGTRLWQLPAILEPLGLALPNMGDIDRQTIAGATQTGTHGTGLGLGGLATAVVGARIVTGTGEVLDLGETPVGGSPAGGSPADATDAAGGSPADATDAAGLLPAVALGLGALGVIVSLTLQCVPRFRLHAEEAPAPLEAVLDGFAERSRAADHFEFFWFPHTASARTKTNTRLPFDAPGAPLAPAARFLDEELANNLAFGVCAALGSALPAATPAVNRLIAGTSSRRAYTDESHRVFVTRRRVRFREMEYGVPLEAVPEAIRELRTMIERRGHRVSFPIEVRAAAADELLLSTAHGRETGYIAVHRFHRDRDRSYFRDAEAILAAHDGRPHWGKMHTRTAAELAAVHPGFERFAAARDRLDPERVFANPYLRRVLGA